MRLACLDPYLEILLVLDLNLECVLSRKFQTCGLRPGVCNTYKIFMETFGQNEYPANLSK